MINKGILKRLISTLIAVTIVLSLFPEGIFNITVNAATASGTCGENLTWNLNSNGVLTISGTGDINNFSYTNYAPWYSYRSSIKSVIIGEGVTSVGDMAFYDCDSMISFNIGNRVKSLGYKSFGDCDKLATVTIPNNVKTIGREAFVDCDSLTSIIIGNGVTAMGDTVFYNCTKLTSVTIRNGVTIIGNWAFGCCKNLKNITIPDSVKTIGNAAFMWCEELTNVVIGNGVTDIGDEAFYHCEKLENVTIGSNVKKIGARAFSLMSPIKNVIYIGTAPKWNKIGIAFWNSGLTEAKRQYQRFKDVSLDSWYNEYVEYVVTKGIFKGTGEYTFSPETNMTRAQMVQVFANLSGIDTTDNNVDSGFSDVPKGMWYTSAVTWAAKNKIVTGVGDGKFDPDAKITREQMCLMLVNYIEKYLGKTLEPEKDVTTFADDKDISDWAKDAVYKCARAGLVNGIGNNMLDPKASATRAQGATLFTNFHKEYMK